MLQISFRDNSLDYNGTRYFTKNAQLITLGAYGEKAGETVGVGKLEPKDGLAPKMLKGQVRSAGAISINAAATSKADFTASVAGNIAAVGFEGSIGAIYDALVANKLKFVQLFVYENDMRKVVNDHPKVRDAIHGYGADGRIAHSVFIAALAKTAEAFTKGALVTLDADVLGIVSASVGGSSGNGQVTTVSLSPGTCIAYGLLKLEWSGSRGCFDSSHVDEPGLK